MWDAWQARAALAALAPTVPTEPVAWACFKNGALQHELVGSELDVDYWIKSDEPEMRDMTKVPLYTSPPQRKPLTAEEIQGLIHATHFDKRYVLHASDKVCLEWYRLGIRNAEAAHGITGESE
jgi:hypothetical protein